MTARSQILDWVARGHLSRQHLPQALALGEVPPTPEAWRKFLSLLLLATGTLLTGAGVIFFFAYNWNGLPPLARFAIVEALLLAAFATSWLKHETATGRATLFFTAILTGALFALIGQTYQLGADPWQLFALWAALILPWAFAQKQPDLWLLSLLLANVALGLRPWFDFNPTWIFCLLNVAAQAVWEYFSPQRIGPRIIATLAGVALTVLILSQIFDPPNPALVLLYVLWLPAVYFVYTKVRKDLFMIASMFLSAIVAITSLCAKGMSGHIDIGTALVLAIIVIVLSTIAAKWMKHLAA